MDDPRRAALLEYLRDLRDRMRLQAWDLVLSDKPAELDDSVLEILTKPERHTGTVCIGTFFAEDALEQRHVVVHELVHLVQADLIAFHRDYGWRRAMAPDVAAAIADRIQAEIEIQADFLARVIAPAMPMPPAWPDGA